MGPNLPCNDVACNIGICLSGFTAITTTSEQHLSFVNLGDLLDEETAIQDGYSSYFSFSKKKSGYSGKNSRYIFFLNYDFFSFCRVLSITFS